MTRPTVGDTMPIRSTVLCDDYDDIKSILVAQQTSQEAGAVRYRELAATVVATNGFSDKACAYIPNNSGGVPVTLVGDAGRVENVKTATGTTTVYIIAVYWHLPEGRFPGYIMASNPLVAEENL